MLNGRLQEQVSEYIDTEIGYSITQKDRLLTEAVVSMVMEKEVEVNECFDLVINDENCQKFAVRYLKYCTFPKINSMHIYDIFDGNVMDHTMTFLKRDIFPSLNEFSLEVASFQPELNDNMKRWLDPLETCLNKVTTKVLLRNLVINSYQFARIVKASSKCIEFSLIGCIVHGSTFEFGMSTKYAIVKFDLSSSKFIPLSKDEDNAALEEMLIGIKNSSLKDSLRLIKFPTDELDKVGDGLLSKLYLGKINDVENKGSCMIF